MFQKNDNTPNNPQDSYESELIYIPEGKLKINNDISKVWPLFV